MPRIDLTDHDLWVLRVAMDRRLAELRRVLDDAPPEDRHLLDSLRLIHEDVAAVRKKLEV